MFNNAGITVIQKGSVAEYEMEQFERVMNINVKGVMHGIKHADRVMIPNKKGCIISTFSIACVMGGLATYSNTASKHAVIGLTKNGAVELGKYGIRVNCIFPAAVVTDMVMKYRGEAPSAEVKAKLEASLNSRATLKKATLEAEDIAEAALYLASEGSKYVSGSNIVIDGGITIVNNDWTLYR
ncbi:hypothetical protein SUGI_0673170 [Cryptomeria japonica]|nr:hypothetical protein SUGI_0673170 [Cryptomeria japonica]